MPNDSQSAQSNNLNTDPNSNPAPPSWVNDNPPNSNNNDLNIQGSAQVSKANNPIDYSASIPQPLPENSNFSANNPDPTINPQTSNLDPITTQSPPTFGQDDEQKDANLDQNLQTNNLAQNNPAPQPINNQVPENNELVVPQPLPNNNLQTENNDINLPAQPENNPSLAQQPQNINEPQSPLPPVNNEVGIQDFNQNPQPLDNQIPQNPNLPPVPPPNFNSPNEAIPPNQPLPADPNQAMAANLNQGGGLKKILMPLGIILVLILFGFLVSQIILPALKKDKDPSSSGDKKQAENITLTYWGLWNSESVMKEIFAEYESKHPNINIEYVQQSKTDYRERLQSELIAGTGPDIFTIHNTWLSMMKDNLHQDVVKEINLNDYFPVVKSDLSLGGETFAIPLGFDSLALYYNPKLLQKAGFEVPKYWNEMVETSKKLTVRDKKGKIQIAGVALGTTNNVDHFSDIMGMLLYQNGANPADTRDKISEGSFKYYTQYSKTHKVWDETLPPSTYSFAVEKVAMIFAPSWRIFQIQEINPDLKFETAPVPQLPGGEVSWATYWAEAVSDKSKYAKEAWELLTFLSSDENLSKLYTIKSRERTFGEPYPKMSLAKSIEKDPIIGSFVKQGPYAKTWYLCSKTYDNGINDGIIKYYENSINSILKGTSPNQVMLQLYQGVNKKLLQYGILTGGDAVREGKEPGSL